MKIPRFSVLNDITLNQSLLLACFLKLEQIVLGFGFITTESSQSEHIKISPL